MKKQLILLTLAVSCFICKAVWANEEADFEAPYRRKVTEALIIGREVVDEWLESAPPREILEREGPRLRRQYARASEEESFRIGAILSALAVELADEFPEPQGDWDAREVDGIMYPKGVRLFLESSGNDPEIELLLLEGYCMQTMAMIMLDMLYFKGFRSDNGEMLVPPYHPEVLTFWRTLADEGLPRGLLTMGRAYLHGQGVEQNVEKGLQFLERSYLEEAWMELAMYFHLQGNSVQARAWWRFAGLETNNPRAWYSLGLEAMHDGDYPETLSALRKALKADPAFYPAMIELARCYMEGWGVKRDYERAEVLLREILAKNTEYPQVNAFADMNLGLLARRRREPGVAENRARFARLRREAAEGNPEAMRQFAQMMKGGFAGIDSRPDAGLHWLKRAAEAGDPEAQRVLGLTFIHGVDLENFKVQPDTEEGVRLLRAAAEAGDAEARFRLGALYFEGVHVPENPERAREIYREMAEEGHPLAMLYLGMRHLEGRGFPKDVEKGLKWLERSAEKGSFDALKLYTSYLIEHNHPEYNPAELYVLLTLGIRGGIFELHRIRDDMARELTEEQLAQARSEVEKRFSRFVE
jgi:TPR repeat protein